MMTRLASLAALVVPTLLACTGSLPSAGEGTATETASQVETSTETATEAEVTGPIIRFTTARGEVTVMLDEVHAPLATANFLSYLDRKYYDNTLFHRVLTDSLVQGGGIAADGSEKAVGRGVKNESNNGLSNLRGTIGAARRTDWPDSATSQFFFNTADNTYLDYPNQKGSGFTVFGRVLTGLEVLDALASVATDANEKPKAIELLISAERVE